MHKASPQNPSVDAVFAAQPLPVREKLLALRQLILDAAESTPGVGPLEETLKWGQVSYLTPATKSGTTVRIDARPGATAVFVNCQTDLLAEYRSLYPGAFEYEGDRGVIIRDGAPFDREALTHIVALALTYHLRKKQPQK